MELARDLIGPDATEELVDEIAARTGGVPMFVEEVARSIVEAGRQQGGALSVPTTLQSALAARLDALSPEDKELVQIACVMGREFQSSLIATVSGRGRAAVEQDLAALCRSGIALRSGYQSDAFSFRHALIQDAAYQSLLRARRRQLHRAVANAIETDRPDIAEAQPELIARHLSEAQFYDKALPHWHRAGQRALARYANLEAIQHFARAIEDAGRLTDPDARARATLSAEIEHAEALLAAGRTQVAMDAFQKAADAAREQRDKRALFLCALGYDEARALSNELLNLSVERLNEALATLTESDDRERCHLMCRLTRAHALLGESEKADHFGQMTIELAHRLREEGFVVEVMLHGLMMPSGGLSPAQMQGRLRQADEFLALVRASGYQTGRYHSKFVGRALSLHLYQAAEFGERQRMDTGLRELEAHSTECNDLHFRWVARHGKAMQAILDGRFAAAEIFADEGHTMGRQVHDEQLDGVYGMQMFTIRREQGRLSEVARVVKRLIDEDPGQTAWRPGFALVACDLGYTEPARKIFLETAETKFVLPHDGKRSTTLAYLAEVCVALGDEVRAEMLYKLLSPYAHMTVTTGVTTVCCGAAGRFLALLAETMGDWRLAEEHFEAALVINRRMRAVPWIAHTQADLGAMLWRRNQLGDRRKAASLFEEASRIAAELGMQALTAKLRQQPQLQAEK